MSEQGWSIGLNCAIHPAADTNAGVTVPFPASCGTEGSVFLFVLSVFRFGSRCATDTVLRGEKGSCGVYGTGTLLISVSNEQIVPNFPAN